MGLIERLARQASIDLHRQGSSELIAFYDTMPFINTCLANGVRIVGIEGFLPEKDGIRPDMATIADFSELDNIEESLGEARSFIEEAGRPGMLFEFVLSESRKPIL